MKNTALWLHFLLIILAWTSPFWVSWKVILLGIIILNLQYLIIGGCYLTFLETGKDRYATFYYHHLKRFFPRINKKTVWITARFIFPVIIFAVAYFIQVN